MFDSKVWRVLHIPDLLHRVDGEPELQLHPEPGIPDRVRLHVVGVLHDQQELRW